jgi:hypothetical protein
VQLCKHIWAWAARPDSPARNRPKIPGRAGPGRVRAWEMSPNGKSGRVRAWKISPNQARPGPTTLGPRQQPPATERTKSLHPHSSPLRVRSLPALAASHTNPSAGGGTHHGRRRRLLWNAAMLRLTASSRTASSFPAAGRAHPGMCCSKQVGFQPGPGYREPAESHT